MRAVRAQRFAARKDIYLRDRVLDQLGWYGGRAGQAHRRSGELGPERPAGRRGGQRRLTGDRIGREVAVQARRLQVHPPHP